MEKQEVPFSAELIKGMLQLHRRIVALKHRFLVLVESPGTEGQQKLGLKAGIVDLAEDLDRHFGESRFRTVSKFNIREVERLELEYLRKVQRTIAELERTAGTLLPMSEDERSIPASEAEIDQRLLGGRIFEHNALERDKLDHLNSVLSFLLSRAGVSKRPPSAETVAEKTVARELQRLKIKNYEETLSGTESSNLDILYKVRSHVERHLRDKRKVNLTDRELESYHLLNHGELYLRDRANGNLRLYYKHRSLAFELVFHLVDGGEGAWGYRGEISGWAEAAVNRVSFFVKDNQSPGTLDPRDLLVSRSISDFLSRAEVGEIYRGLRDICAEKSGETERLERRVEQEMKDNVSRALDEL